MGDYQKKQIQIKVINIIWKYDTHLYKSLYKKKSPILFFHFSPKQNKFFFLLNLENSKGYFNYSRNGIVVFNFVFVVFNSKNLYFSMNKNNLIFFLFLPS